MPQRRSLNQKKGFQLDGTFLAEDETNENGIRSSVLLKLLY